MTNNITNYYRRYKTAFKRFQKNGCPLVDIAHINEMRENYTKLVEDSQYIFFVESGSQTL